MKQIKQIKKLSIILCVVLFMNFIVQSGVAQDTETIFSIDYEKYVLENGLQVILHEDKSDPIISAAILYHVGSNREVKGKTGFAHLFEHMLFQASENVGQDQFFKKIQDAGGTLNGGTWRDGTIYYEIVPKNALEMVLWLESDRMGYMINTVTEAAFSNQQDVVQNEKRQRVDNTPYGHTNYVIDKNLFPEDHPYNWQVIGEFVDLQNATVEDVKEFHSKFYNPNNATLLIVGDFEIESTKSLIEKYFGEIKGSAEVESLSVRNVSLNETIKLFHEDNFAKAAQLTMVWPAVENFNTDQYALDFLAQLLANGKKAPLYNVLVKDKELTSRTSAYNMAMEIAGKFIVKITANADKSLNDIEKAIFEAFEKFEKDGITDTDIERVKAGLETDFYNGISSILGKSFQLASYNVYAGDPSFITKDIANIKAVTKEDVMRVYEKYIKDKAYIVTSFVPKGQIDLIVENSIKAEVVEEEINETVETEKAEELNSEIKKTPSSFDRTVEPEQGLAPELNIPESWKAELSNGLRVYGIEHNELPLVQFNIVIKGGHLLDKFEKIGVANLMTDIMKEGTLNKTPEELEEEIELLGANIGMFTSNEEIIITANTLTRNFDKTLELVEEMLLEPRWDEEEFARIKTRTINYIKRQSADPEFIAGNAFNKLLFGDEHMLAYNSVGTEESVNSIELDDLKEFYNNFYSPTISRFLIVGDVSRDKVMSSLKSLEENWKAKEVKLPEYKLPAISEKATLYFVDFPGAKQSVINIGMLSLKRTDENYYPTTVMNYKLGGSFSGNVNLILREEKGFTYGARTHFRATDIAGKFTATASVRTNATLESVMIFKEEMEKYRNKISDEDLSFTKNALIKSNARKFETYRALIKMIKLMSAYDLAPDFIKDQQEIVQNMTVESHMELAQKYITPDKMIYVVVGDAATQFSSFNSNDFDEIKLIDKDGKEVDKAVKE